MDDPFGAASTAADDSTGGAGSASPPPGLRAQLRAIRDAIKRLLTAHLDLAKAEASEIGAEIGRVALLGGIAFGAVFLLGFLLPIGLLLFLGELVFGSIGWGLALGSVALVDVAVVAILVALGVTAAQIGRALLLGVLIGALVLIPGVLLDAGLRPWVALALLVALIAWPILAGYSAARAGIDTEAIKARFYPTRTIETTKETIEWVRERTPLGRKS
ncbi:MAG: hypothetical protein HW391_2068 [Chloroflexi bacterium]|nr:hypothetical protein [Chloroflexota bacterium]